MTYILRLAPRSLCPWEPGASAPHLIRVETEAGRMLRLGPRRWKGTAIERVATTFGAGASRESSRATTALASEITPEYEPLAVLV